MALWAAVFLAFGFVSAQSQAKGMLLRQSLAKNQKPPPLLITTSCQCSSPNPQIAPARAARPRAVRRRRKLAGSKVMTTMTPGWDAVANWVNYCADFWDSSLRDAAMPANLSALQFHPRRHSSPVRLGRAGLALRRGLPKSSSGRCGFARPVPSRGQCCRLAEHGKGRRCARQPGSAGVRCAAPAVRRDHCGHAHRAGQDHPGRRDHHPGRG